MIVSEKVRRLAASFADLNDKERLEFVRLVAPVDEQPVSAEWREELHRRSRDIDEGRTELIEGEDFLNRLRAI